MKNLIVVLFCLAATAALTAQDNHIDFEQTAWQDILKTAGAEDKIIFLDAYASWCGPCKMMSKNVFTDAEVAGFYNERFVNAKIDMEKGEGVELAKKFGVQAYPTLLYISAAGEVVHRAVGYHDAAGFIGLGKEALDPTKRLDYLAKQYESGNRDPKLLKAYAKAASQAMAPNAQEILKVYLDSKEDWTDPETMQMVLEAVESAEGPYYQFVVENLPAYKAAYGDEAVVSYVNQLILESLDMSQEEEVLMAQARQKFEEVDSEAAGKMMAEFRMNYYSAVQNIDAYAEAAVDYFSAFESQNHSQLNNVAWSFYESVEDEDMLREAVKWAKKSVELQDAYFNNDTLAWLYYKLGNEKQAREVAEHAIELAKASGEDYSGTQSLLDQIGE